MIISPANDASFDSNSTDWTKRAPRSSARNRPLITSVRPVVLPALPGVVAYVSSMR